MCFRYADVEGDGVASLLAAQADAVPEATLLAEAPTEKKMNKADGKQQHTTHRHARRRTEASGGRALSCEYKHPCTLLLSLCYVIVFYFV
jgi:hypothetical protein